MKKNLNHELRELARKACMCMTKTQGKQLAKEINSFVKQNNCDELADRIFYETGAGETLMETILNGTDITYASDKEYLEHLRVKASPEIYEHALMLSKEGRLKYPKEKPPYADD